MRTSTAIIAALLTLSTPLFAFASDCSKEIKAEIQQEFKKTKDYNLDVPKLIGRTATKKDKYTANLYYVDKAGQDCDVTYILYAPAGTCDVTIGASPTSCD